MGLFNKLKNVLSKTRESFSKKMFELFSMGISDDFYDDLTDVLISSDISVNLAYKIVDEIRDQALDAKTKDKDYVLSLLKQKILGTFNSVEPIKIEYPAVIMVVGVNGVGKTTSIGKLAGKYVNEGKSVTVGAGDTFRAAASDQLTVWADRANARIVKHTEGADASAVVFDAISSAKAKGTDVLIIDTAGRLHVKANLMEELKKTDRVIKREYPTAHYYKFIVLDATTGQNALSQVEAFNEGIGLDGVILTKLDGTAKGGFIISLASEKHIPVAFVGTGEKMGDIEEFDSEEFVEAMFE